MICAIEAQSLTYTPGSARGISIRSRLAGDERLAASVREGNEAAFEAIYQRYHQPLYRYCRSIVGNDADAQDALQSTFTSALVALRSGRRDAPLRPWLYRIGHNESISLLRRRRPEQELPEEIGSHGQSAHDAAEARARLEALVADLRELPERQRGALVMRELSGLSHDEIAVALGISVGVAKQTVLEARRSLLEFAEGRAMSCPEIQQLVSDGDGRTLRGRRVRAHLRDCPTCAALADAIPARRADLMALAPALPAVSAAGLLARITGAGSGHGGGGAGFAAGAAGKGLGVALSTKTLATGAAILATAAVGTTVAVHKLASSPPASARSAHQALRTPARGGSVHSSAQAAATQASRHAGAIPASDLASHLSKLKAGQVSGRSSAAAARHGSATSGASGSHGSHGKAGSPGATVQAHSSPGHSTASHGVSHKTKSSHAHTVTHKPATTAHPKHAKHSTPPAKGRGTSRTTTTTTSQSTSSTTGDGIGSISNTKSKTLRPRT